VDRSAVARKAEICNGLASECRKLGITFLLHNHASEFEGSPSEMELLLPLSDPARVRLVFDVGNPFSVGLDPVYFTRSHLDGIDVFHIKDVRREPDGKYRIVPLGEGQIDLPGIYRVVKERNWSGWWLTEHEDRVPDPRPSVRACRAYLRKITGI
jgi:inosose dehydratase